MTYTRTTWANGNTVTPALLNNVEAGLSNVLTTVINAADYGVLGNGSTGSATANNTGIDAAIAAAFAAGGGIVQLPPGLIYVNTTITFPMDGSRNCNVTLRGAGKNATTLRRNADVILLDISGTATATWLIRAGLEDLTLVGGGNTGWNTPVVRTWYTQQLTVRRVRWDNSYASAIDAVQLYDSWFYDIEIDYCGNTGVEHLTLDGYLGECAGRDRH